MNSFINNVIIETEKGRKIKKQRDEFLWNACDIMIKTLRLAKSKGFEFNEKNYIDFLLVYSGRLSELDQVKKAEEIGFLKEGIKDSRFSEMLLNSIACEILELSDNHRNNEYGELFENASVYACIVYLNEIKPEKVIDTTKSIFDSTVERADHLAKKNFNKYCYLYCYILLEYARYLASYYCETKKTDDKRIAFKFYKSIEPYIQELNNQELLDTYYYEISFFLYL